MINSSLWGRLEKVGTEDLTTKAYLLNLEDTSKRFEFMLLPSRIQIAAANNYRKSYAMFGNKGYVRYENSQLITVAISDLLFTVPNNNRSMIPVEKDLDRLRFPSPNKLEPPQLSFVFGKRSIQPLLLEEYSIDEQTHINGLPTTIVVSLSFTGLSNTVL